MYDAIVVGARVAGAPAAMLLARQGHSVLLVDRSRFPSDIMSTHFIVPEGVERLKQWGLLDQVAATNCPPVERVVMHLGPITVSPPPMPGQPTLSYCPRRHLLDKILVDAAVAAGTELREGVSVRELIVEDGAVVGIRGELTGGGAIEERARVVIGADGQHSMVARAVGAETYNEQPAYTCGYYSYFSGVPVEGAEIHIAGDGGGILAFATNDDLTCLAVVRPADDFAAFKAGIDEAFYSSIDKIDAALGARVRAGKREEKWIGTVDTANFFRKPYGPGWALVGDAGYHKDPITGLGISDAFRDAEFLSEALHSVFSGAPLEETMSAYQKRRDEAAMPLYQMTTALASRHLPGRFEAFLAVAAAAGPPA